ncbi:hypothetical protein O181_008650 [Austropuccinia psidii MF-1]|uniref:Uncharacterized protein n=1 Tax=Austropuccinia psidii MF-1 TaxID=1389203 RepID=A0A9Q3BPS1_9BASI|nr:hypothetical protein [Austropuccinia psidii MF-1]
MAQGFKNKKTSSSSTKSHKPQQLKKGARVIPPSKPAAVAHKLRQEKISKSVNGEIERLVVAKSIGKLSIMKSLKDAEEAKFQKEKSAKEKNNV